MLHVRWESVQYVHIENFLTADNMSGYPDLTFKISENPDTPKWIGFENPSQDAIGWKPSSWF